MSLTPTAPSAFQHLSKRGDARRGPHSYARAVAAWALVEGGDPEAIDLFLTREGAEQALADCLRDELGWRGSLWIEEIELAGTPPSPN